MHGLIITQSVEKTTSGIGGHSEDCGLWEDPVYQARKEQLGRHIDDVREVMPHCVIKDVRERYTEEQEAQFILCPQKSEQISFLKIGWKKEGHMIFGV